MNFLVPLWIELGKSHGIKKKFLTFNDILNHCDHAFSFDIINFFYNFVTVALDWTSLFMDFIFSLEHDGTSSIINFSLD